MFIIYNNDFQCLYLFGGKVFFHCRDAVVASIVPVVMLRLSLKSVFTFIALSPTEEENRCGVFL
ncbi:hypothetical protein [Candidatus Symbiopectobacterium sp. 'North America']|uniref:hypothetical protein n=1 Tax=Candidatus Symbiopectobacterium sp. 'North America' TaxID=2794574 RepID=UPI0018CA5827|nr:hypothetical protein [Candidatus Symbiopectobacterium sp. 'North America']